MTGSNGKGAATAAPFTMTWQQAIVGLYLVNDYGRACRSAGREYGPDWFRRHGVLTGLTAGTTRRVALRLAREQNCVACGAGISENSDGDHIVAVSRGGPPGAENYIPMCGPCNSSKGTRDLLDWWRSKGKPASGLPADVLTAYCRLVLPRLAHERACNKPAPDAVTSVLGELAGSLPTLEHKGALWLRIRWVVGWRT
jgi:hypothetical protein